MRPRDHGHELAHGRQRPRGSMASTSRRPLGQERQALRGLGGEVLVAPQPVGRVERVQAHGELPGAVEEDERQLHARG